MFAQDLVESGNILFFGKNQSAHLFRTEESFDILMEQVLGEKDCSETQSFTGPLLGQS